jgi:hypothetical protein
MNNKHAALAKQKQKVQFRQRSSLREGTLKSASVRAATRVPSFAPGELLALDQLVSNAVVLRLARASLQSMGVPELPTSMVNLLARNLCLLEPRKGGVQALDYCPAAQPSSYLLEAFTDLKFH